MKVESKRLKDKKSKVMQADDVKRGDVLLYNPSRDLDPLGNGGLQGSPFLGVVLGRVDCHMTISNIDTIEPFLIELDLECPLIDQGFELIGKATSIKIEWEEL